MTASSEAGSLRRIRPDVPLRYIDDDHDLVDHDRQTEHVAPTSMKTSKLSSSAGSVPCMPEGVKLGMHELPVSGILQIVRIAVFILLVYPYILKRYLAKSG